VLAALDGRPRGHEEGLTFGELANDRRDVGLAELSRRPQPSRSADDLEAVAAPAPEQQRFDDPARRNAGFEGREGHGVDVAAGPPRPVVHRVDRDPLDPGLGRRREPSRHRARERGTVHVLGGAFGEIRLLVAA